MSQSVSGDPLDLDAASHEASEDRRVGALMRQRNNRETMTRRAEVIEALVAAVRSLRQERDEAGLRWGEHYNAALDAARKDLARAEAERDHARAEWHRHNERADAFRAELSELRGKIAAVEALHQRNENGIGPDDCGTCSEAAQAWVRWPCPTARVLSGSQEPGGDR